MSTAGRRADADDDADGQRPWVLGCVILTKTSTCLVNVRLATPSSCHGPINTRRLCGMLTALHTLAGGAPRPTASYLTLSHFSVAICESAEGFVVAVVTDPGAHRESAGLLARTVARHFARAGGPVLRAVLKADVDRSERRMHEYTVKDELAGGDWTAPDDVDGGVMGTAGEARPHASEPKGLDAFSSFAEVYLRPMLKTQRPARHGWLEPLARLRGVLSAHLLAVDGEDPAHGRGVSGKGEEKRRRREKEKVPAARSVVSLPGATSAAAHPLAALAGVGTGGAVWDAVTRHAGRLVAARSRAVWDNCEAVGSSGIGPGHGNGKPLHTTGGSAHGVGHAQVGGARSPLGQRSPLPPLGSGGRTSLERRTSLGRALSTSEATTPPLTAVLTFDDLGWDRPRRSHSSDEEGPVSTSQAVSSVGEGTGATLRVVLHAVSYPGAVEGSACIAAFCASPTIGGEDDGERGGSGGAADDWSRAEAAANAREDVLEGDKEELLRRHYFPRSYKMTVEGGAGGGAHEPWRSSSQLGTSPGVDAEGGVERGGAERDAGKGRGESQVLPSRLHEAMHACAARIAADHARPSKMAKSPRRCVDGIIRASDMPDLALELEGGMVVELSSPSGNGFYAGGPVLGGNGARGWDHVDGIPGAPAVAEIILDPAPKGRAREGERDKGKGNGHGGELWGESGGRRLEPLPLEARFAAAAGLEGKAEEGQSAPGLLVPAPPPAPPSEHSGVDGRAGAFRRRVFVATPTEAGAGEDIASGRTAKSVPGEKADRDDGRGGDGDRGLMPPPPPRPPRGGDAGAAKDLTDPAPGTVATAVDSHRSRAETPTDDALRIPRPPSPTAPAADHGPAAANPVVPRALGTPSAIQVDLLPSPAPRHQHAAADATSASAPAPAGPAGRGGEEEGSGRAEGGTSEDEAGASVQYLVVSAGLSQAGGSRPPSGRIAAASKAAGGGDVLALESSDKDPHAGEVPPGSLSALQTPPPMRRVSAGGGGGRSGSGALPATPLDSAAAGVIAGPVQSNPLPAVGAAAQPRY